MVGGRSYEQSQFNRVTRARRQPGSVFKPFVYLAALERGLTPDSTTYDLPIDIKGWSPKNASGAFTGTVTLRQGLAQSLNTVAVRLQQDIGTKSVIDMARRLGVASPLREDASLALGTSEVNPLEMAGAYTVVANGGMRVRPRAIRRVLTERGRVLFAETGMRNEPIIAAVHVAAMNDMLGATMQLGTGRRAQLAGHPAAGKTGTTQDFRDAWFIGYTAQLAAAVWIGNDDGTAMDRITGGSLPAEIWREVMAYAHRQLPSEPLQGLAPLPRGRIAPPAATPTRREIPIVRVPSPQSTPTQHATAAAPPLPSRRAATSAARIAVRQSRPDRRQLEMLVRRDLARAQQRQLPASAPGSSVRTLPRAADMAVPRMPGERIGEDFVRRALASNPASGGDGDPGFTRGFDVQEIRRQLATRPASQRDAATDGLMSLGAP